MNDLFSFISYNKLNMTEDSKYFYAATIKKSTAVIDCITANFTWSPLSEKEILQREQ